MRTRSKYGTPYTRSQMARYWWDDNGDWFGPLALVALALSVILLSGPQ